MPFSEKYRQAAGLTANDATTKQILAWQKDPTPQATAEVLKQISPILDRAISAHAGQSNPLMRSRARRMALNVLKRYDPSRGAKLSTYLFSQLHGLRRVARKQQQILTIPERASLERGRLQRLEAELKDELGRDPADQELADRLGVSAKRIRNIQRYGTPVAEGTAQETGGVEGGIFTPGVVRQDNEAWMDFIHSDMDPQNQIIMDNTLGRHGAPMMSNQELSRKLKITPGAVSQRKKQIQEKIDLESELSPFGEGGL
jgi:DNA-directed RNA polymerase specialized sigma subunit